MLSGFDRWQFLFLAAAAALVLFRAWRGWKLGVVRQLIALVALGCAYFSAIFGGHVLSPFLRTLGVPNGALGVASGVLLGLVMYVLLTLAGSILFKKTSEQSLTVVRLGYGSAGAVFGALMGLVMVWIAVLVIRLLGTVAETQVEASQRPQPLARSATPAPPPAPPSAVVRGLAQMKHSLEQGTAGAVVEQVDPIPGTLYSLLTRLGRMISNEQAINRFLAYPGVKTLTEHPKIAALHTDPQIARDLISQNYFGLVRNERIMRAARDREIAELMARFEFEKALDFALTLPKAAN